MKHTNTLNILAIGLAQAQRISYAEAMRRLGRLRLRPRAENSKMKTEDKLQRLIGLDETKDSTL